MSAPEFPASFEEWLNGEPEDTVSSREVWAVLRPKIDEAIDWGRQLVIDATAASDDEITRLEAEIYELREKLADALWQRDEARRLAESYLSQDQLPWETEGEA